ncbi:hypothetical protein K8T06_04085 [bacterium]|nr:hypothetical protein [bacterium]
MKLYHIRLIASLTLLPIALMGCYAGSYSKIVAGQSPYPVSLSPCVRDYNGEIINTSDYRVVGNFHYNYTTLHMLFGIVPLTKMKHDISTEVHRQIKAVGGEALVNLTVISKDNTWNEMSAILALCVFPSFSTVEVNGDIIKRTY